MRFRLDADTAVALDPLYRICKIDAATQGTLLAQMSRAQRHDMA